MPGIQRIRKKIIDKDYYISSHAEDEMLDDGLERIDIENAILKGKIEKKLTEDIRGTNIELKELLLMVDKFMSFVDTKKMGALL